jgi:hypothetical protein
MLGSSPTAPPRHVHKATVVWYRQTSPELGPMVPLAPGAADPERERAAIPNPSC